MLRPLLTLALTLAGDALAARLVPSHAFLEPGCRRKINAKARHHAIHQRRLL
jgi:hypothetical protein